MTESPNYNTDQDMFVNEVPGVIEEMLAHSGFWANPRKNLTNNFLFNPNTPTPDVPLPEVRGPLPSDLRDTFDTVKFTWLGHATVLASINGKTILFDPVFSESAAPVSWAVKRYQPPAIDIDQLPPIDFIVISHDHYDHLDMNAVRFFRESDPFPRAARRRVTSGILNRPGPGDRIRLVAIKDYLWDHLHLRARSAFFRPNRDNRHAKDPVGIMGGKDRSRLGLF